MGASRQRSPFLITKMIPLITRRSSTRGRHQLRVDIAIAVSLLPSWVRRTISDRNPAKARGARTELVERMAIAIERRFRVTGLGSDDGTPTRVDGPLFGGPAQDSGPDDR